MRLLMIKGTNLDLVGRRERGIYGDKSIDTYLDGLYKKYNSVSFTYFQSNHEGEIIDKLHEAGFSDLDGIILNAGAYTHTSLAIADAISAINVPVVEVHISNVHSREEIRHHSMISPVCKGVIAGFGLDSYRLAVESFLK